jgi:hypothetical protein
MIQYPLTFCYFGGVMDAATGLIYGERGSITTRLRGGS